MNRRERRQLRELAAQLRQLQRDVDALGALMAAETRQAAGCRPLRPVQDGEHHA